MVNTKYIINCLIVLRNLNWFLIILEEYQTLLNLNRIRLLILKKIWYCWELQGLHGTKGGREDNLIGWFHRNLSPSDRIKGIEIDFVES